MEQYHERTLPGLGIPGPVGATELTTGQNTTGSGVTAMGLTSLSLREGPNTKYAKYAIKERTKLRGKLEI